MAAGRCCTSIIQLLYKLFGFAHGHEEAFAHGAKADLFFFSVAVGYDQDVVIGVAITEDYQCSRCRLSGCLLCVLHICKAFKDLGNKKAVATFAALQMRSPRGDFYLRKDDRKGLSMSVAGHQKSPAKCRWAVSAAPA